MDFEDSYIEEQGRGVEEEETVGSEKTKVPFDANQINVKSEVYSIYETMRRIESNEIDMFPDFQREFAWTEAKQSRLIESILLRIPLPSFYLDATNDDKWMVVDGLQRLNTLFSFIVRKKLKLTGLDFLKELDGLTFDGLLRQYQRLIENTQLSFYIITPDTPKEVKFTIFKRINTGGLVLNSQEIRHCLNQGKVTKLLAEMVSFEEFKKATDHSISEKRMADRECALRFCAFFLEGYRNYVKPDLDEFLINTMETINVKGDLEISELGEAFKKAMNNNYLVFGEKSFRKIFDIDAKRNPINKALFEVWSVLLCDYDPELLKDNRNNIVKAFSALMNNDQNFVDAISQGTGDVKKVKYRFGKVENLLREATE